MDVSYDAGLVGGYFDNYGEREWARLDADVESRISFHLHRAFLVDYIAAGAEVLEAGAGPGRFTIELAKLGARITVGDLSAVQLEFNRAQVAAAGHADSVVARKVLDIVDLSEFASETFDAVVAYGGPLSYVLERADDALDELLRVVKRGGHVLLSVMSLFGATRKYLPGVVLWARDRSLEEVEHVIGTGDQVGEIGAGHVCHMYRWAEFEALLRRHSCTIVAASAANYLSVNHHDALSEIEADPVLWEKFLGWEADACRQPGALDGGTHIIAVVRRT
ncbi:MAG TPA: class I SAM-dependent methyltransferase [Pyrinomonadaceae bacterium]|jgi:SAM-dependent methyltransferase|nr:class I SAM-dependent methyltransferase [Pyrinomonadaceae bacterium]